MSIFDLLRRADEPVRERAPLVSVKGSMSWGGGRGYNGGDGFTRDVDMSASAYSIPYIPVREGDARNSSIVASAVGWAMRNVVQVRPRTVKPNSDGGFDPIPNEPCAELILGPQSQIRPEDRAAINYRRMLRAIAWSLMMDGNGYLLKVRNGGSKPIGLDWLPHTAVEPIERLGYPSIIDAYEIRSSHGRRLVPRSDVIHFTLGIDPDYPARGCSALKSVMRLVMTDNQIAVYSHAILRNPFPGLIVSPKDKDTRLMADDMAAMLASLKQVAGGERAGGAVGVTEAVSVEKLGYSPDDLAIRELARLPEERISAVFGIPAIVCGLGAGLERSTFANFEQAREAATEEFLVPLWDDIGETFTEQLLPEFGYKVGWRTELDYSQVKSLQEDTDQMHNRVREDFRANLIDRAEAKRRIGMVSGPEDEGVYFYQLRGPLLDAPAQGKAASVRLQAEALV